MQELFQHPLWTNKLARTALFCILALAVPSYADIVFPSLKPLWLTMTIILVITLFVLMAIINHQTNKEHEATAEAFMRDNSALYRHYHIEQVIDDVAQFTQVQLSRRQAIKLVQKLRDEYQLGPIEQYNLDPIELDD